MIFFLVALTIFGSAYAFVGWRLSVSQGPLGLGIIWTLLAFHFVATFVSFALIRKVGPDPSTVPLFWFVYVGMGLFSFVFAGVLLVELAWGLHDVVGRVVGGGGVEGERRDVVSRRALAPHGEEWAIQTTLRPRPLRVEAALGQAHHRREGSAVAPPAETSPDSPLEFLPSLSRAESCQGDSHKDLPHPCAATSIALRGHHRIHAPSTADAAQARDQTLGGHYYLQHARRPPDRVL